MWLHKTSCLYDITMEGPRAGQARCGIVDMLAISPYFVSIAYCLGHRTNEKTQSGFVFHCFRRCEAAVIISYSTRYNWHEQLVVKRQWLIPIDGTVYLPLTEHLFRCTWSTLTKVYSSSPASIIPQRYSSKNIHRLFVTAGSLLPECRRKRGLCLFIFTQNE